MHRFLLISLLILVHLDFGSTYCYYEGYSYMCYSEWNGWAITGVTVGCVVIITALIAVPICYCCSCCPVYKRNKSISEASKAILILTTQPVQQGYNSAPMPVYNGNGPPAYPPNMSAPMSSYIPMNGTYAMNNYPPVNFPQNNPTTFQAGISNRVYPTPLVVTQEYPAPVQTEIANIVNHTPSVVEEDHSTSDQREIELVKV